MTTDTLTLADRREAAAARLAELEREQGVALLDDKPFDASALNQCRDDLAALERAEDETVRRARADASRTAAEAQTVARKALAGSLDDYLAAVGRVEQSARSLADDLKLIEGLSDTLRTNTRAAGVRVPVSLERSSMQHSHSAFLATLLSGIGGRSYYGAIRWTSVQPISDLSAHARKFVAAAILPLTEGE